MKPYMCEPTWSAKTQRKREAEMALLAIKKAEANNKLTVAAGGEACVVTVQ